MSYAFGSITWEDALREFLIHLQAYRAPKTVSLYRMLVGGVARWAGENKIRFHEFGKRHLDRYLSMRIDAGISAMTLHHEALAMKVFQRWCVQNDLLERSSLAEYRESWRHCLAHPPL